MLTLATSRAESKLRRTDSGDAQGRWGALAHRADRSLGVTDECEPAAIITLDLASLRKPTRGRMMAQCAVPIRERMTWLDLT
jgi:hypothetical protein